MKKIILNKKIYIIVSYIVFITFFTTNCYAAYGTSGFSSFGSRSRRIEDEPSGTSIENFIQKNKKKSRTIKSERKKLELIGKQLNRGHDYSNRKRAQDKRVIQVEIQKASNTTKKYKLTETKGKNEDGSTYKRYSANSTKVVEHALKKLGLFKEHYSEIKKLFPENHAHEWSLMYNYQQSEDSQTELKFTLSDQMGFSEASYGIYKNKVFAEEKDEDKNKNDKKNKEKINTELAKDKKEKSKEKEDERKGEFHWVRKKRIRTNIEHKEGSSTYAVNNGPEATNTYDLVTGYHEKIDYLGENDNRIIEREVDKTYHNEKGKRVVKKENSVNYKYNENTFQGDPDFTKQKNRDKAHITKTNREYDIEEYVKSKKEEGMWLPQQYEETIRDNTAPNKIVEKHVKQKYDRDTNRLENKMMAVHEYSDSEASNELDKYYGLVQSDYSYVPIDAEKDEYLNQYDKYKSIRVSGHFNSIEEVFEKTKGISELNKSRKLDKNVINSNSLFNNVLTLRVTNYNDIAYNERGEKANSIGNMKTVKKDKEKILSYVTHDFDNSTLKRDDMRRIKSRKEIITDHTRAPEKKSINKITDIQYGLKGLQRSLVKFKTEKGPGLDKRVKVRQENMIYNDLGQLSNYHSDNYDYYGSQE